MKNTTIFLKKILFFYLFACTIVAKAQSPSWGWIKSPVVDMSDEFQETQAISSVTDSNNNVYVGYISNSSQITFGNNTFTNNSTSFKFYLVKYTNLGDILWAKTTPAESGSAVTKMVIDSAGNVYALGFFNFNIVFDGITLTSGNVDSDMFLAKFSSEGQVMWAKKAGSLNDFDSHFVSVSDLAIDQNNNIYVSGAFFGDSITFDTITLTASGQSDIFLVKYDTNGNAIWAKKGAGKTLFGQSAFIKTDSDGYIYMAGNFQSPTIVFDNVTLTNTATFSMFLTKFNPDGVVQWGKKYGINGWNTASSITIDNLNNIYVGGGFTAPTIYFDTFSLNNTPPWGSYSTDIFLVKYNNSGTVSWAKSGGGTGHDIIQDIKVDLSGNLYMCGSFGSPQINLGTETLINGGVQNSYISKISSNGQYVWNIQIGGNGLNVADNLSIDSDNQIYIGGGYRDGVTFGANAYSAPTMNSFIAKLNQATLHINDFNADKTLIYPNPAKDIITIANIQENRIYTITDITGRNVTTVNITGNTIDISTLASGIYMLNTENSSTKFIKE